MFILNSTCSLRDHYLGLALNCLHFPKIAHFEVARWQVTLRLKAQKPKSVSKLCNACREVQDMIQSMPKRLSRSKYASLACVRHTKVCASNDEVKCETRRAFERDETSRYTH